MMPRSLRAHCIPLLLLALLAGCAFDRPWARKTPPAPKRYTPPAKKVHKPRKASRTGVYHVVKRGETLWGIGRTYGVAYEQIAVLNGIRNPDRLRAGKRLFIPRAKGARRPAQAKSRRAPKRRPAWAAPVKSRVTAKRSARKKGRPRFSWPLRGRVIRRFGTRGGHKADGILIAARERAQVRASAPGQVIFSDFGPGNLGRLIILRHHGGEYHSIYARVAKNLVREGESVSRGAPIALAGRTPRFKTPRLHFEIRHRTRPKNPLSYLPRL